MALDDDIDKAEKEEMKSQEMYRMMAVEADRAGQLEMAFEMRRIADDEGRHAAAMRQMHTSMHASPEIMRSIHGPGGKVSPREKADEVLGRISQSLDLSEPQSSRISFPRTTGDWSDLAGRIKDFDPQNMSLRGEVNRLPTDIYDDEDGATDSKRKLFDLAIGFGIS